MKCEQLGAGTLRKPFYYILCLSTPEDKVVCIFEYIIELIISLITTSKNKRKSFEMKKKIKSHAEKIRIQNLTSKTYETQRSLIIYRNICII